MVYQRVNVMKINTQQDMSLLEQTVGDMLGGEHHKCSFIRSQDFITLRLRALYHRSKKDKTQEMLVIYGQNLKITLDADNNATVYLLDPGTEPDPNLCPYSSQSLLGKRACQDDVSSDPESPSPLLS
jgi:hypothetical protein